MRTVLQRGGMAVTTCADALEAPALASRIEFDAAITDIEMPGMTGLEFIDRLRAEVPFAELAVVRYLEDVVLAPSDVVTERTAR